MNGRTTLVDLVPQSSRPYCLLFAAGLLIVAVLELGYAAMPYLSPSTTDGRVAALDLDAEGSLCVWVSSFTLLAAAAVCLLIDLLANGDLPRGDRRRTRLWRWAACCWVVMSVDECSSLHEAFKEMMSHATGERIWHDGTLWWVLAYAFILSITGCLLLWQMRAAPTAVLMFCCVAGFYGIAVLAELSWLTAKDARGVMIEEGCEMLGNFSLLTAMCLYARQSANEFRRRAKPTTVYAATFAETAREPTPVRREPVETVSSRP